MSQKGVSAALCTLENDLNAADSSAYCTLISEEVTLIAPTFAHAIVKIHIHQESAGISAEMTIRCVVALHSPSADSDPEQWRVSAFHWLP